VLAVVGVATPAGAASLDEIRGQGQRIGAEVQRLLGAGQLDHAAERRLIADLGPLALGFIEVSDDAARTGRDDAMRDSLRPAFEAVHGPLDAIYNRVSSELEGKARAIMDADGDLEALYEGPEWQEAQAVAAEALYYRNWLAYYGAQLFDGERRKKLLEAAENGFSQFAVGERRDELLTESLLGRALCHMELGNYEWAVRDLKIVMDEPSVSAERKSKARLALLESYVRAGKRGDALAYSQRLLSGGDLSAGDAAVVRFFRLQVLLAAIPKVSAGEADAYRAEAAGLMERLRRSGPGWAGKVDAVMSSQIDDPAKWIGKARSARDKWELARMLLAKESYDAAAPVLQQIVESDSDEAKPFRAEASYWLGVARFKAEDYAAAATRLSEALAAAPEAEFAAEAEYLRFKALEVLMAKEPTEDLAARYRSAMEDFLARHPGHPSANEARYRLGELLQAEGELAAALARYAEVADDEKFALRAAFGSLQSHFALLEQEADAGKRGATIRAIGEDFQRLHERTPRLDPKHPDPELNELLAKATLLEAVYFSVDSGGGADQAKVAELLEGYETRFPNQADLFPQALRLRLAALRETGDFDRARQEIEARKSLLEGDPQKEHVERLASSFVRAAGARKAKGDEKAAQAAEQVAIALYELALEDGSGNARRELTMARLYESTDRLDDAARAYQKVLDGNPNSLTALEGLARLGEKRGDAVAARGFWERYTSITRPGDAPWYRGQYQQARLALAGGEKRRSCEMLKALRPSMPGLSDEDLRRDLGVLYEKACG
jgi:tetratricopeptide (TPR) repeat protein